MKEITAKQMSLLESNKIVMNTRHGIVSKTGEPIGFYRTRNRRYVEDRYADIARELQYKNG